MKKIYAWEPWFFIFFGIFHLHRIWGLFDRVSYADFWLGILENKGAFYFILMGSGIYKNQVQQNKKNFIV